MMRVANHQFEPAIARWLLLAMAIGSGAADRQRRGRLPDVQGRPRPERSARPVDRGRLLLQHPVHDVDAVRDPRHVRQPGVSFDSPRSGSSSSDLPDNYAEASRRFLTILPSLRARYLALSSRFFVIRPRVPAFVERNPKCTGIAKKPRRKHNGKQAQHDEPLAVGEHIAKEHGEVHHDDQRRGDAVVEIDRAQQVAGIAIESPPAAWHASCIANQPRKIGDWPQAGQRSRSARHHKTGIGCERFASVDEVSRCCECCVHQSNRIARRRRVATRAGLPSIGLNVTVPCMYTVARFLQVLGLTIPLLAIVAQLNERITLGQMLGFLVASMTVFIIGHTLQRYSGQ